MSQTYHVTLRESIQGVKLVSWRTPHGRRHWGAEGIPWKLAHFLQLMPGYGEGKPLFTTRLYGIDNFDAICHSMCKRVTKRGPNRVIVTVEV